MKKSLPKILLFTFACAVVIASAFVLPKLFASADTNYVISNSYYTLDTEGTLIISKNTDTTFSDIAEQYTIKNVILKRTVYWISSNEFFDCKDITSITIPSSVRFIGNYAFYGCTGLTSITIPDSVTSIGQSAFHGCTGLTIINIPKSVTNIGRDAFHGCTGLTNIEVDSSNTVYDSRNNCNALIETETNTIIVGCQNTVIPDSVTSIGDGAFDFCTVLTSITIPDSVTSIGSYAFDGCSSLESIELPDSVTSIGYFAFWGCTGLTSITIPDSVTSIGSYAFYGCTSLESIELPDSVASIGSSAFENCTGLKTAGPIGGGYDYEYGWKESIPSGAFGGSSLTSVTIADSITCISNDALEGCTYLENITVDPENKTYDSRYDCNAIIETETNTLIIGCNNTIIPNNVTGIGEGAFKNCSFTNINIPSNVKSIGDRAFYGCVGLVSVTIESGVISVGKRTFDGCTGLTSISIPDSVTTIGEYAFSGCTGLKTAGPIGGEYDYEYGWKESIPKYAFEDCSNLTSITISDSVTSIGDYAFSYCTGLTEVTIGKSVTSIGDYAFSYCTGLTSVTIPDSVTSIGWSAFYSCTGLKTAGPIGGGYNYEFDYKDSIPIGAFSGCSSLTSIIIPNSITSIGNYAFYYCSSITSITIPNGVTSIGSYAFYGCKSLKGLTIPDEVTRISEYMFYGCTALTDITIPSSVTSIGSRAFENCTGLTSITIPESVTSIGGSAFEGCTGLKTAGPIGSGYNFEYGWKESIPKYAFEDCSSLTSIIISDSVTSIGSYAFEDCTSITSIIVPDSVTEIGAYAFYGCTCLTSITIGNNVSSIGDCAIKDCTGLTEIIWNAKRCADFTNYSDVFNNAGTSGIGIKVIFGDSVETIPAYLFYVSYRYSPKLVSVTIGNKVTSIGGSAFSKCSGLTSITIPNSVTSIGRDSFFYCKGLTKVNYIGTISQWAQIKFGDCYSNPIYYSKNLYINDVLVTDEVIEEGVTSISDYAFYNCQNLKSIAIPDSVTSIGRSAFYCCENLEKVTIGNGVTSIGSYAFEDCSSLTSITIPDSVTSIGRCSFFDCIGLTSITIPDSVTSISDWAFANCTGLETVNIPNSVEAIGTDAFYNVNNIKYSQNMTAAGSPWGAKAVDAYVEGDLYFYDSSKTILLGCNPEASGTLDVPDTVEEVGANTFYGCDKLTEINFTGKNEISFSSECLVGCSNLVTLLSPNTTSDGITFTESVDLTADGNGILFCNRKASLSYTVPVGISYICENAFAGCTNVEVTIPDTVSLISIGKDAFLNNLNYNTDTNWSNGVFTIGKYIIQAKESLSGDFEVPEGIKCIADYAFNGCENLTSVVFSGKDLKGLGRKAFSGCTNLTTIENLPVSLEQLGAGAFEETGIISDTEIVYSNNILLSVPKNIESIEIKEGTTCIADGLFENCLSLKSVTIPEDVTRIGDNTFKYCINLKSVKISSTVEYIGEYAFKDCIELTSVDLPSDLNEIDRFAFYGCEKLESFDVSTDNETYKTVDSVLFTKDGKKLLQYPAAKAATTYSIPGDVEYIESLAFRRCNNLETINLIPNLEYGLYNPFEGCKALCNNEDTVYSDGSCTVIVGVTAGYTGTYTVKASVTEIGNNAFKDQTGITEIIFEDGSQLKTIGENAFMGCIGLTSISFPEGLTEIKKSAFEDCEKLEIVTFACEEGLINQTVVKIGDKAFCNTQVDENTVKDSLDDDVTYGNYVFHQHEYGERVYDKYPTCTENGMYHQICACDECNYLKEVIVPALGHNIVDDSAVEPTCTSTGLTAGKHCSECDYVEVEQEIIPALGHDFGEWEITESGCGGTTSKRVCNRENCTAYETSFSDEVCHTWETDYTTDIPADCVTEGEKSIHCSKCEAKKDVVIIPAVGHTVVITEGKPATCTSTGLTEGSYCSVCGKILKEQTEISVTPHNFGGWQVIKEPTASEEGLKCRECKDCKLKETVAIDKLDYAKVQITNVTNITVDYKSKVILHATCDTPGTKIVWCDSNGNIVAQGDTYTVDKAQSTFKVYAYATDNSGNKLSDSESALETVTVKSGFFDKLIAFFRELFGALPVWKDNSKQ